MLNKNYTVNYDETLFVSFIAKQNGTAKFKFEVSRASFASSSKTNMLKIILGGYFGVVGVVVVIFCI